MAKKRKPDAPEPNLFDHAARRAEAEKAKADGMAQAEGNAVPEWSILMLELVEQVARTMPRFTADDVFDLFAERPGAPTTHDSRAFGPVMMRAAKKGICRQADCRPVKSRRKSLHSSLITVWDSLIYEPRP